MPVSPTKSGSAAASTPADRCRIGASSSIAAGNVTVPRGHAVRRRRRSSSCTVCSRCRGEFAASFACVNLSGPMTASYTATDAEVDWLGRDAAAGGVTSVTTVPLVDPQTLFEDRISRLDLRLGKVFTSAAGFAIQRNLDAYNALNSNAVRAVNTSYGSAWTRPTQILDPRIFQLGGQISF